MRNQSFDPDECTCLPDCEVLQFSLVEKEAPLDGEQQCQFKELREYTDSRFRLLENRALVTYAHLVRGRDLIKDPLKEPGPDAKEVFCRALVKNDIALVTARFDLDTFMRSKMEVRMSFAGRMANFGKVSVLEV